MVAPVVRSEAELAAVVAEPREIAQALRATAAGLREVVSAAARLTRPDGDPREVARSATDEIERARRRGHAG